MVDELQTIVIPALTAPGFDASTSHFSGTLENGFLVGEGGFVNHGIVRPGGAGAAGYFPVGGDYVLGATGVLEVEIGGVVEGDEYDVAFVTEGCDVDGGVGRFFVGGG